MKNCGFHQEKMETEELELVIRLQTQAIIPWVGTTLVFLFRKMCTFQAASSGTWMPRLASPMHQKVHPIRGLAFARDHTPPQLQTQLELEKPRTR